LAKKKKNKDEGEEITKDAPEPGVRESECLKDPGGRVVYNSLKVSVEPLLEPEKPSREDKTRGRKAKFQPNPRRGENIAKDLAHRVPCYEKMCLFQGKERRRASSILGTDQGTIDSWRQKRDRSRPVAEGNPVPAAAGGRRRGRGLKAGHAVKKTAAGN